MYIDFLVFYTKGILTLMYGVQLYILYKKKPKTKTLVYKNLFQITKQQDLTSDLALRQIEFFLLYDLLFCILII